MTKTTTEVPELKIDLEALQKLAEAPESPWAQQAGETDSAYRYFLVYRNLGPARSVRGTARMLEEDGVRYEHLGVKADIHPQTLYRLSAQHKWHDRAHAWDVALLNRQGIETAVNFIGVLNRVSQIALRSLTEDAEGRTAIRPRNWKELMEFVGVFAQLVPQETIDSVQAYAREHRVIDLSDQQSS